MSKKYVQALTQYMAGAGSVVGATNIVLTSLSDIYENAITSITSFGDKGYLTLEPDSGNEESAVFTTVTVNVNGTVTLGGVKTTLAQFPYTETSGLVRHHSGGTKVVITDNVSFWNTFANKANDETILGKYTLTSTNKMIYDADPTITDDKELATKKYVDDIAIAGGAKATEVVYGLTKLSVAAVSGVVPIVVGDNDPRVPTANENNALAGTSGAPSNSNKYVTNADTDTAATADKIVRRIAGGQITVAATPSAATDAASKGYVESFQVFSNGIATITAKNTGDTTVIAHGLGRIPKALKIVSTANSVATFGTGIGFYDGTNNNCIYFGNNQINGAAATIIHSQYVLTDYNTAVATWDATNFTLTWTKGGSGMGCNICWEAQA